MHINFGVIMIYDLLYYKSCENADGLIIDITHSRMYIKDFDHVAQIYARVSHNKTMSSKLNEYLIMI